LKGGTNLSEAELAGLKNSANEYMQDREMLLAMIQQIQSGLSNYLEMVSSLTRAMQDTQMSVINNMRA
jgi:hypothetical protein